MDRILNVSVVITVYNRANLFKQALESVVKQKKVQVEIIVVDDFSEDEEIKQICKKYSVKYLENEKNLGAQESRNKGALAAKYDYIAFLDSDDIWKDEEKLLKQCAILKNNQEVSLVFTGLEYIDEYGKLIGVEGQKNKTKNDIYFKNFMKIILKKDIIGTYSSVMIRKKDFLDVGLCDISLPARQDWDLWIRLSILGQAVQVPTATTQYRLHENQISSSGQKKFNGYSLLLKKHEDLYIKQHCRHCLYLHLFKLTLMKELCKYENKSYNSLVKNFFIISGILKIISKVIIYTPFVKYYTIRILSKTYLFKGM